MTSLARPKIASMAPSMLEALVPGYASHFGLDPRIVLAIVLHESAGGNDGATRYETGWSWFTTARGKPLLSRQERRDLGTTGQIRARALDELGAQEFHAQATSWGLMQVMGSVAREHGLRDPSPWVNAIPYLCQPRVGLWYGCRHLARYLERYGDPWLAVAAYNAGSASWESPGKTSNEPYVAKIRARYEALE